MFINYSDIPSHENLFLDYMYEFENVMRYYDKDYRNLESYLPFFSKIESTRKADRNKLTEIILAQYEGLNPAEKTITNIKLLSQPKTIAVVTGQQLGIFGGPLYTIYKTITAVKLCEKLKSIYQDYNFVPVFWLEADDHDYEEVRSINILNNENLITSINYDDQLGEEVNRGSISSLIFNDNINLTIENLEVSLRNSEFTQRVIELLKKQYASGKTFLDAFRDLLIQIFDEYGLVVFDPSDAEIKKMLSPIFSKELRDYDEHASYLVERSAELEEVYHAQVKVKAINLFYLDGRERLSIEPGENDYRLKNKRKKFTKEEILQMADEHPEKFSPNVLLRPVCQDYLFPTGFYVAGPGEISYFAQVSPLYKMFGIEMPVIYPRSSATIVEKGVQNILDKYQLTLSDIFAEEKELISKIISGNNVNNVTETFENTRKSMSELFENISSTLMSIDKTLVEVSDKSKQRIDQTIEMLEQKAIDAEKRKHDATFRQIAKVKNVLFPNENLQERELNIVYFTNKYGPDFLKWLFEQIDIDEFAHQIVNME